MESVYHTPVMVEEALAYLMTSPDGVYLDATLGGGGHAEAIVRRLSPGGKLIAIDRDPDALQSARTRLQPWEHLILFVHDVFSSIREHLDAHRLPGLHGALFDLGVSSYQLDTPGRGFSFQQNAPLDMRMGAGQKTAAGVLNSYGEKELADVFYRFGEEKKSRRIARKVAEARALRPLSTSIELAEIVKSAVGERMFVKSLARIFQALRIEVNEELEELRRALELMPELLLPGGRIVVISYHSLEDRIVKNFLKDEAATHVPTSDPFARSDRVRNPRFRILTKKPIVASGREQTENPRSRSAKLRAAERIQNG